MTTLTRKARQMAEDPVLRRWMWDRLIGRSARSDSMARGRPPYLNGLAMVSATTAPVATFAALADGPPEEPIVLALPGETVRLEPDEAASLAFRTFADTETLLALHRFAWLPLQHDTLDPRWVSALWRAWRDAHGRPDDSWAWHPYTAAERAINMLDLARRHGLPRPVAETVALLAQHGEVILDRLEYFGESYTGNHLANNGRGLFRLGLALGLESCAEIGGRILVKEASRIFAPSGVLREGSSHYHVLITRNYIDAWLAARTYGRPETAELQNITSKALAVLPHLTLPGGMPLVGDISPDCPPKFLAGLQPVTHADTGWIGLLTPDDRVAVATLQRSAESVTVDALGEDGWWRVDAGRWAGLWHVTPDGWCPMPGHGHQDLGAFEIHFDGVPLFVDSGRGAYGEDGEAASYLSANAHNSLTVDGADPAPPNRPYYDDRFRRVVLGPPPTVTRQPEGLQISYHGFARLDGIGRVTRSWRFEPGSLTITNRVEGRGHHVVRSWLHTTHRVTAGSGGVAIDGDQGCFHLSCDGDVMVNIGKRWTAYGVSVPASVICITQQTSLPLEATIIVEVR